MRFFLKLSLFLSVAFLVTVGCGTPGAGGPGGDGISLTALDKGGPAATLSPERQAQLFQEVLGLLKTRPLNSDQDLLALGQWLAGQEEFKLVLISLDGSVWAVLSDGQVLVVANNRPPSAPTALAPRQFLSRLEELPGSPRALLVNGFAGSRSFTDVASSLQEALNQAGYRVVLDGSVEGLQNAGKLGLLYLDGHGANAALADFTRTPEPGEGRIRGLVLKSLPPEPAQATATPDATSTPDSAGPANPPARLPRFLYAAWTSTQASPDSDKLYKQDLTDQNILHFIAPSDIDGGVTIFERRYAITRGFVEKYLSFEDHSLVFINACSSANAFFSMACQRVGADAYVGWTLPVGDRLAGLAANHLFRRMLPGERSFRERPLQPPQTLDEVQFSLLQESLDLDPSSQSRLSITSPGEVGLLVPSVRYVRVPVVLPGTNTVILEGVFGSRPGRVLVDGVEVQVSEWAPTRVEIRVPRATVVANNKFVSVVVEGRRSNEVIILD